MKKIEIKHDYWFGAFVLTVFLLILIYSFFFELSTVELLVAMINERNILKPFSIVILSIHGGLLYMTTLKLYIGLNYYNSTERCYIEDNNFIYERICYFWGIYTHVFEQKTIPVLKIENIELIPYKEPFLPNTYRIPVWYFFAFTPYQRILIEYGKGEQFKIWNFRKMSNFWREEKKKDKELIQKYYMDIKTMIDEKKKELENG